MPNSVEPALVDKNSDKTVLIELYSIHSGLISANESKRQLANQIYTAIVTALIAAGSVVITDNSTSNNVSIDFFALTVVLLCCVWYLTIQYHRRLSAAKFMVILEIEKNFSIQPYADEWKYFKSNSGRLLSPELTTIERAVPVLVGVMSLALLINRNCDISWP